jgi:hypothetical protein
MFLQMGIQRVFLLVGFGLLDRMALYHRTERKISHERPRLFRLPSKWAPPMMVTAGILVPIRSYERIFPALCKFWIQGPVFIHVAAFLSFDPSAQMLTGQSDKLILACLVGFGVLLVLPPGWIPLFRRLSWEASLAS